MMVKFTGGLTCSLGVADLGKSIDWYTDILGCELLYRRDDIAWCELSSPVADVNIGLSQVEEPGGAGGATLTFGVADIAAAKATLDGRDIRQDGAIQEIPGLVKLLTFFDPDGNALMFYEMADEE